MSERVETKVGTELIEGKNSCVALSQNDIANGLKLQFMKETAWARFVALDDAVKMFQESIAQQYNAPHVEYEFVGWVEGFSKRSARLDADTNEQINESSS